MDLINCVTVHVQSADAVALLFNNLQVNVQRSPETVHLQPRAILVDMKVTINTILFQTPFFTSHSGSITQPDDVKCMTLPVLPQPCHQTNNKTKAIFC